MLIRGRGDGVMGGLVPYESATVTVLGLGRSSVGNSVGATPRVPESARLAIIGLNSLGVALWRSEAAASLAKRAREDFWSKQRD